jgi:hypothetical protein
LPIATRKAIDIVEKTIKEEGIDCCPCRLHGYLFPHDDFVGAMDIILKVWFEVLVLSLIASCAYFYRFL